jgi:putative phosphoribosyl transferase
MIFSNRAEAGRRLAQLLTRYANRKDVIVLGLPRGGVPVAFEIASRLKAPLDVLMVRKLGVPGQEELAFGAIAPGGIRFLDMRIIHAVGLSDIDIELVTQVQRKELERRERVYRGERPTLSAKGLTVIVVDDGIATGSGMQAAIRALRQMEAARIVIAVPVAPPSTCESLRMEVDDLVCATTPDPFYGIGQFYLDFSQVTDHEVQESLSRAARETGDQAYESADALATDG